MTTFSLTPDRASPATWQEDLAAFRAAKAALDAHDHKTHPDDTNTLFDTCALAEEKVLAQPAPDIDAVAEKLLILWDEDVWSELPEGEQFRGIIGDLRRLAEAHR